MHTHTRLAIALAVVGLTAAACAPDQDRRERKADRREQQRDRADAAGAATAPRTIDVWAERDGCTVYTFNTGGPRYFVHCKDGGVATVTRR